MCGIVGYIGKECNIKEIIKKLEKLEYRGYDSSGITFLENDLQKTIKEIGNINNLYNKLNDEDKCFACISHTRWATHGKPSTENAHPHQSKNEIWSIVHNGIIENYLDLKNSLKFIPNSQTDTSILAQLLEEDNIDNIKDFISTFKKIKGSFAIVALNKNKKDELFIARNKSPLYIGKNNEDSYLIASDPICFVDFCKEYWALDNGNFAHIKGKEITIYDKNCNIIEKKQLKLDNIFENASKQEYNHYMIKEIMEQPIALKKQIQTYKENNVLEKFDKNFINSFNKIIFVGCGTAYHASMMGSRFIEKILNIPSKAEIASEFIYKEPVFADEKSLYIFVSQSGETADTLRAMEIAKGKKATCIALTNVLYSTLASNCDYILPVSAGPEIAVASTKAYVCQLSSIYMFASHLYNIINDGKINYYKDIENVSDNILNFDFKNLDIIANKIKNKNDCIFLGKDLDYINAMEASLKLKEVSYINSSSYPSGELKHGFLALVEEGSPLFVFATNKKINAKSINASMEAKSRGAEIFYISNQSFKQEINKNKESNIKVNCINNNLTKKEENNYIFIDEENELLCSILSIVPMQYLAYKVSILKGINPDQPRNLAKSVTVE